MTASSADPQTQAPHASADPNSPAQRRANRRLGLVLATVALAFGLGFMIKIALLGR